MLLISPSLQGITSLLGWSKDLWKVPMVAVGIGVVGFKSTSISLVTVSGQSKCPYRGQWGMSALYSQYFFSNGRQSYKLFRPFFKLPKERFLEWWRLPAMLVDKKGIEAALAQNCIIGCKIFFPTIIQRWHFWWQETRLSSLSTHSFETRQRLLSFFFRLEENVLVYLAIAKNSDLEIKVVLSSSLLFFLCLPLFGWHSKSPHWTKTDWERSCYAWDPCRGSNMACSTYPAWKGKTFYVFTDPHQLIFSFRLQRAETELKIPLQRLRQIPGGWLAI